MLLESEVKARIEHDTLPEWSKGVDSSSTSASCVGSNPTGVSQHLLGRFDEILRLYEDSG